MSNILSVNDKLKYNDGSKFFNRTKIIGGYDPYKDKNGVTRFGTKVFETENMIVLGGGLFTLEKLFNVTPNLEVDYLENYLTGFSPEYGSGLNTAASSSTEEPVICLFGVGTGGASDTINSTLDVKYWEREVQGMIPFRQTELDLAADEVDKYWFKSKTTVNNIEKTQYYLKSFESVPEIKALWLDSGEEGVDGSEVQSNVHSTPSSSSTPIETFVELTLKLSKNDIQEYFNDTANVGVPRINTIGLFTGKKVTATDPSTGLTHTDYRHVKLFSKLNINNEVLTSGKELTIVYRIYTS